jgi:hypothetical protein
MTLYVVLDPSDSKPLGIFDNMAQAKECGLKFKDYTGLSIYIEEFELNKSKSFELQDIEDNYKDDYDYPKSGMTR